MRWRQALARVGVTTAVGRDAAVAAALAVLLSAGAIGIALLVTAKQPNPAPLPVSKVIGSTVLTILGCATIGIRRRWPRTALTIATTLVLACAAFVLIATGPALGVVVCAYTVATLCPPQRTWWMLTPIAVYHAVGGIAITRLGGDVRRLPTFWGVPGQDLDAMLFATTATYLIPAVIGIQVRRRRQRMAQLTDRAERLEAERAARDRAAAADERRRIARELHDIAAHDLSAIVVQAGAADRLVDGDPDAAKAVLRSIRGQGRQTLTALRQLVGIMRDGDAGGRAPQPTLARLDELIASARTTGMTVALQTVGDSRPLPPLVDLAAYRVVQEALSNARQHAPGKPVSVRVAYRDDGVELAIRNRRAATVAGSGTGHGLAGMRERVRQAGGTVTVGPDGNGNRDWLVMVRLPA
jgi:signal transduction histidine kinase